VNERDVYQQNAASYEAMWIAERDEVVRLQTDLAAMKLAYATLTAAAMEASQAQHKEIQQLRDLLARLTEVAHRHSLPGGYANTRHQAVLEEARAATRASE
jgi:hypothetical protein